MGRLPCAQLLRLLLAALTAAVVASPHPAAAVSLERVIASGLDAPIFVAAPAGDPRLFVVERGGRIQIFENGVFRATFLDLGGSVSTAGEGGLLGLAFPPDYASSRAFYVYYTAPGSGTPLTSRISRFRASSADPNAAAPEEKILLSLAQPYDNHNGGTVAFGPDGMLYMAFGDGGYAGDPLDAGQRGDTLLGKMIRIDVSFSSFEDDYRIPADNPFVGPDGILDEIWALGLRNPYRFSFDRLTGDLYIADVGQTAREEVDVEPATSAGGRNYGWDVMEGTLCYDDPDGDDAGEPPCAAPGLTGPIHEYGHTVGCSITGGYVYRGSQSAYRGHYFFADYCSSGIYSLQWNGAGGVLGEVVDRTAELAPSAGEVSNPVGFGEDGAGELYVVDPYGEIFRIPPAAGRCGDGRREGSELCDDGNTTSGDGCDANCRPTGCGNGIATSGEQCDDGNATSGDGCDANCTQTRCGNGVRAGSEQCDDGNQSSGDGCDANCTQTGCGNGVQTAGEQCDDGDLQSGDGCDANCTPTACGNGVRTGSEQCDDGNLVSGDGCDANCRTTACGNGVKTGSEQCDDGNLVSGDGCDANCRPTACGNGAVSAGEACDDGNQTSGDGCDANCRRTACGNGVVTSGEQCDDGDLVSGDGCDANCRPTACGNGIVTDGEQCDDGNQTSGDGCDPNCEATGCGNGVPTPPEQCDDGNQVSGDGCDRNCRTTSCGNGIATAGELCDDGNQASGDGCDANCTPTGCGNGVVSAGEACDDGNQTSGDGCDADCSGSFCGDGVPSEGELCDDGNHGSGDGCDANCTPTGCGNGIQTGGEACDDGNLDDGDGCNAACELSDPPQTRGQRRCILAVNEGVARVARAQSRNQAQCLSDASSGRLGAAPTAFDGCLHADLRGRVSEAARVLAEAEAAACSPAEPPELALGADRLAGLPAARALPTALVRDVFGAPAAALPREARAAARCQREVLARTAALFDDVLGEARAAQAHKLEGRGMAPARTDAELGAFVDAQLAQSAKIARGTQKLLRRTIAACEDADLASVFPGCAPSTPLFLASCAVRTTRCRACALFAATNPRLPLACDAFDDGRANGSCAAP